MLLLVIPRLHLFAHVYGPLVLTNRFTSPRREEHEHPSHLPANVPGPPRVLRPAILPRHPLSGRPAHPVLLCNLPLSAEHCVHVQLLVPAVEDPSRVLGRAGGQKPQEDSI